jgi:hypothetical protein
VDGRPVSDCRVYQVLTRDLGVAKTSSGLSQSDNGTTKQCQVVNYPPLAKTLPQIVH